MRELPKQEDVGRVNQVTPLATSWHISKEGKEGVDAWLLCGPSRYVSPPAGKPGGYETFRVPSPMSKVLDGVAWLAASLGSTLEDVVIIVVIIVIINIGCHDRTEL